MAKRPEQTLTPKQSKFITEYLVDLNATHAAIRAGYAKKTANREGTRLLSHAVIRAAIHAKQAKHLAKVDVSLDRVLAEIARIAFLDVKDLYEDDGKLKPIKDWPEDARRAVAGIEHETRFEGRGEDAEMYLVTKVKTWDKVASLTLLLRRLGALPTVHTGPGGGPVQIQPVPAAPAIDVKSLTNAQLETLREATLIVRSLTVQGSRA